MIVDRSNEDYLIAVGLDDSDASWKALQEAIQQAKQKQALLHIVSIQESHEASYRATEVLQVERTSREKLERAQVKARIMAEEERIDVQLAIVIGNSTGALLDYAKKHGIKLLVVGETGHSSIFGALLGTTAEKIVRNAPCSVLVVR